MQENAWDPAQVRVGLTAARSDDHHFADGSILGSMCTEPHELARLAHSLFNETNLGDPDHFPGTAKLEEEVLQDALQLVHAPKSGGARFLTGGTEANLFALYIAREATGKHKVVLPRHAHFSFEKAARLLQMELVWVDSGNDFRADIDALVAEIDDETALVVAVAGSTELGLVDDIEGLAKQCVKMGVRLHVDGAFGGYILPFMDDAPAFDFQIDGVWSVSLDPHKMGRSVIPAGILTLREESDWENVAIETPYVSTTKQSQLLGTRPGAAVAATWAVHRAMGKAGYRRQTEECMRIRSVLADGLRQAGYSLVATPELNVVTFRVENIPNTVEALANDGLRVNVIPRLSAIRIVVGPHVTENSVARLLSALPKVVPASA